MSVQVCPIGQINKLKYERSKLQEYVGKNKENLIKRTKSDMILMKHHSFNAMKKEISDDKPWYQSHQLWSNMMRKTLDKTYKYKINFLDSHQSISTKMRSVLFDWLIEVSEVYQLHRETYHLSIAYIDQYLCHTNDLPKKKFQLLGITSLFVAAKIEEIYPPKLTDFAYVTDNTCSEEDILDMELDLMNVLNWFINPITAISWLLIYLQVEYDMKNNFNNNQISRKNSQLIFSNNNILQSSLLTNVHQSKDFIQIFSLAVRLLDLCSLDIEYNQYSKHILAASAIVLYKPNWSLHEITGLSNDDILKCQQWMKPFYEVLLESSSDLFARSSSSIPMGETYSIQIHNVSVNLLTNVYERRSKFLSSIVNIRPFRDLINNISWPSKLLEKQKNEDNEQQQINTNEII